MIDYVKAHTTYLIIFEVWNLGERVKVWFR